jgi:ribonuclease-3
MLKITNEQQDILTKVETSLGICFADKQLLLSALTHKSFTHKNKESTHNERLEFLGDAVLKIVASEYLFLQHPDADEGILSKIRAQYISDKNLAIVAKKMHLGEYIFFADNEVKTGGRDRESNLANGFEALLGAYFLDQGFEQAKIFMLKIIDKYEENFLESEDIFNCKSKLQELLQQAQNALPEYVLLKADGPDHIKLFHIQATIKLNEQTYQGLGIANTKKAAEQLAAKELLKQVEKAKKQHKSKRR